MVVRFGLGKRRTACDDAVWQGIHVANRVYYDCKYWEQNHIILTIHFQMLLKESGCVSKAFWGSVGTLNRVSWAWCRQERTMKTVSEKVFPGPVLWFQADWEQREQYPAWLSALWLREKCFARKWVMKGLQWRLRWVHLNSKFLSL